MGWIKHQITGVGKRPVRAELRNQAKALIEFLQAQPRPILTYQMSKVGSTSVYESLRNAGLYPLHVHRIATLQRNNFEWYNRHGRPLTKDIYVGQLLRAYLQWTSHRIKAISLVRDPVARYVSMLYHHADASSVVTSAIEETIQAIMDQLSRPDTLEDGMFKWFDREIKATLGVDVLKSPFNREAGYGLYHGPRADVLVLKLERLSNLLPTVVSDFVGAPLQEVHANVGRRKARGEEYERVKRELHLPEPTRDRIYGHDWVQHFYTEEEIAAFKEKWR